MAKIKCENCGTLNDEDFKFCEKCGNSLNPEKSTKSESDLINKIDCPFCGQKIPIGTKKCSYCGEWVDPSKDDSNTNVIVLGYILSILFGWLGLIPAIYLLTRDSPRSKKHGKIQLIINFTLGIITTLSFLSGFLLLMMPY